jgi:hypothetical protein
MQAAHAEFKGYTFNRQCACKQMPVLRHPNACDDVMRFNAQLRMLKPCACIMQSSISKISVDSGLLPSPAGCAPDLEEGLLGDFLLCNEDEGVIQFTLHGLGVSDEVGGDVSPVKLHALHHL